MLPLLKGKKKAAIYAVICNGMKLAFIPANVRKEQFKPNHEVLILTKNNSLVGNSSSFVKLMFLNNKSSTKIKMVKK